MSTEYILQAAALFIGFLSLAGAFIKKMVVSQFADLPIKVAKIEEQVEKLSEEVGEMGVRMDRIDSSLSELSGYIRGLRNGR